MTSLAYQNASTRQQKLLDQLAKDLGIGTEHITNVTYRDNIPVEITYNRTTGAATRNVQHLLGGKLNQQEISQRRTAEIANYTPEKQQVNRPNNSIPNSRRARAVNKLFTTSGGKTNGF